MPYACMLMDSSEVFHRCCLVLHVSVIVQVFLFGVALSIRICFSSFSSDYCGYSGVLVVVAPLSPCRNVHALVVPERRDRMRRHM